MGCRVYPSQSNFLMFRPTKDAIVVFEELLAGGIIIRPLNSYGLPDLLRVSVGTEKENKALVSALKVILK
jgi:histidinol-phosphate aminotransferase